MNILKYFNHSFYLGKYNYLKDSGISTKQQAFKHFITVGIKQNLLCHESEENFDHNFYITYYKDLSHLTSLEDALNHWRNYGYNEGRICHEVLNVTNTFTKSIKNDKKVVIYLPPGIGDAVWSITKIPDIIKKHDFTQVFVCVKDTDLNRSQEFLKRFSFITDVIYENFRIHPQGEKEVNEDGTYNYTKNSIEFDEKTNTWKYYIICNNFLERGVRLENWLTDYETDFNIAQKWYFKTCDIEFARNVMKNVDSGYCVFYLGPLLGNTTDGHNKESLWTIQDWIDLGEKIHKNLGLKIVLVGAPYDKSYTNLFYQYLSEEQKLYYTDLVGKTAVGDVYAVCKSSKFVISYQSGIGIFSAFLNIPTSIWWRPYGNSISTYPHYFISFYDSMGASWASPEILQKGLYVPLHYLKCTPQSIFDTIVNNKWIENSPAVNVNSYQDFLDNINNLYPLVKHEDIPPDRPKSDFIQGNRSCGASGGANNKLGTGSNNREQNVINYIESFKELEETHNIKLDLQTMSKLMIAIEVAQCQNKINIFNINILLDEIKTLDSNMSNADILSHIFKKFNINLKYEVVKK